jgi:serine protease Do
MTPGGSYLGVGLQDIDSGRAKALKLKEEVGVEITHVEEDSPASRAGFKSGDVVLEYNGQKVDGFEQFSRLVRETPVGREVKVLISRDGSTQTLVAKIAARRAHGMGEAWMTPPKIEIPEFPMPDVPRTFMSWSSGALGVEAEGIRSQLAQYFGVKEGVLVRSVTKNSPAEKGGIRAGDVIVKVDDRTVATPGEVTAAIRSARSKKSVSIVVMRERKETTVTITLDDRSEGYFRYIAPVPPAGPIRL